MVHVDSNILVHVARRTVHQNTSVVDVEMTVGVHIMFVVSYLEEDVSLRSWVSLVADY